MQRNVMFSSFLNKSSEFTKHNLSFSKQNKQKTITIVDESVLLAIHFPHFHFLLQIQ